MEGGIGGLPVGKPHLPQGASALLVPSTFPTWPSNIFAGEGLEPDVPLGLQRDSILTSFLHPYASQPCVRQTSPT